MAGGLSFNPDRSDVDDSTVATAVVAVTTTAIELKVGGTRNPLRQSILLQNDGSATIYLGPATVTSSGANKGHPLLKDQAMSFPIGNVAYFAITASGSSNVIVTELA